MNTDRDDPDLAALLQVSATLSSTLASIDDRQWDLPTPCEEWNLAALVDHVTGGNWFSIHLLGGRRADSALEETMKQFGDGSATRQATVASVSDQLASFSKPEALEGTYHHVSGQQTGRQILRLRLHDLIVHAWDLANTLTPPTPVPEQLLRWATAELTMADSLTATHFALGASPATVTDDGGASYLACFGRAFTAG